MWAATLCWALLLVPAAAIEVSDQTQFVLFSPSLLKANTTGTICVQLANIKDQTPLEVILDHPSFSIPVFDTTVPPGDFFGCNTIYIPSVKKADLAYITMKVDGRMERTSVVVNRVENMCVVQTDRHIYKPGDKVQFRAICVNNTLFPVNEKYSLVEVIDPSGNRLMQVRDVEAQRNQAILGYKLVDDAELGYYQIVFTTVSGQTVYGSFSCQKYVLPKFEVTLTVPGSITPIDEKLAIGVRGMYTYGQPLVAKVKISVCRNRNTWDTRETCNLKPDGICETIEGELGPRGVLNVTINLEKYQFARHGLNNYLNIQATVRENGTDIQVLKEANVWVSGQIAYLNYDYESMDQYYKPGLNFTGTVSLRNANNEIMPNETVEFYVKEQNVGKCSTDKNGDCLFSISTDEFMDSSVIIQARFRKLEHCFDSVWSQPSYPYADFYLTRFYSPSGSFVTLQRVAGQQSCGQTITVDGGYSLNREALKEGTKAISLIYMVMSKAAITLHGKVPISLETGTNGTFSFPLTINSSCAPSLTVLTCILLDTGEMVADSMRIEVEPCFQNQVSLNFSKAVVRPGSNVTLHLTAAANSQCGIRAIDESVNVLNGGVDQSLGQEVYNRMPYQQLWGLNQEGFDLSAPEMGCVNKPKKIIEGLPYAPLEENSGGSVYDVLAGMGMQFLTGMDQRKPKVCPSPNYCPEPTPSPIFHGFESGAAKAFSTVAMDRVGAGGGALEESIRKNFPETWLYADVAVKSDGTADLSLTIPDTITDWKADGYCMSESEGFGATVKPASVTCFQDFFTEMALPYSIVRNEVFIMKVIVFNYSPQCVKMQVTLANSSDFIVNTLNTEHTGCVCQNERTTYPYTFIATSWGTIEINASAETIEDSTCNAGSSSGPRYKDTIVKKLLVEIEGIQREETRSALICTKDGPVTETINVTLPDNAVNDSGRAYTTCVGDFMGVSIQNINNLVDMPSGCAEQVSAKVQNNLVALEYLEATGGLTPEKKAEIANNLATGYARMLTYINADGSVSPWTRGSWNLFSQTDLWVACRFYTTFVHMAKYTFVDESATSRLEHYIASKQDLPSGAFSGDGRIFNIAKNNVSMTAHIVSAFLKAGNNVSHPVIEAGFGFLDTQVESWDDTDDQAVMCYAYALAGYAEKQERLLGKMAAKEVEDGNALHLKGPVQPVYPGYDYTFRRQAPSATISSNAYYALCLMHRPSLSPDELTHIARIFQFLAMQMNGRGGFSTTTDTAIALEAMAKFQNLIYVKDATNTVVLKSGDTQLQQFSVNDSNKFLLQRQNLPAVPGRYTADVTGNGCTLVQTTLKYNIKLGEIGDAFKLTAWTSQEFCVNGAPKKFDIHVNVSYAGVQNSSSMAILEVKLPSGCDAAIASLSKLSEQYGVSRYDTSTPGTVTMYFNQITREMTAVSFTVEQTTPVENLQPSPVRMYSFYNPDEFGYMEYAAPCSLPSSID